MGNGSLKAIDAKNELLSKREESLDFRKNLDQVTIEL
jgi:hypothetical protein